jgi:hypothetical protein
MRRTRADYWRAVVEGCKAARCWMHRRQILTHRYQYFLSPVLTFRLSRGAQPVDTVDCVIGCTPARNPNGFWRLGGGRPM